MTLAALRSTQSTLAILELDQALSLAQLLGLDLNLSGGTEQLKLVITDLITHLASYASAVVAEPLYSYPLLLDDIEKGLILRLDQPPHQGIDLPKLTQNWGVEEIANNYAIAKLDLKYHPAETAALEKKKIVGELASYCHQLGSDFILKLEILPQSDESKDKAVFQTSQLTAVQEFRSSSDLFILDYPGDALAAATMTAELDQPWIVNLNSAEYEENKTWLRSSLENGAIGFVISAGLWSELGAMRGQDQLPDLTKIQNFIETTARDRMIELSRIVKETKISN